MPSSRSSRSASSKASVSRSRSRSRGRSSRASKSRSRSRSRSRSTGRKPRSEVKEQATPPAQPRQRSTRSSSRSRELPKETPTRHSSRLEQKHLQQESATENVKEETKSASDKTERGKQRFAYEFGGPFGTFFMTLGLPIALLMLNLMCDETSCVLRVPPVPQDLSAYYSPDAVLIFLGWVAFQVLLALVPIGPIAYGQPLRGGKQLEYNCNGFSALVVSGSVLAALIYQGVDVGAINRLFLPMSVTAMVFALLLSIGLYVRARRLPQTLVSKHGNSGCMGYDFFMGRELNPRLGPLDLKFFCEMRPGLIGWTLINWIFVHEAYVASRLTPALVLVAAFQTLYVADALFYEDAILSTMDITTEGFGFMLAFGDLAWVPFIYCLQTRYLLMYPQQWNYAALAGFVFLQMVGYIIFRGSNSQKDKFRKDPNDPVFAALETIPSPSGKKLLASGWWGLVRHPNYLGDLIMALAWSLPCGFSSVLPYFYPVYFFVLLAHRTSRDNAACRLKHKAAWERYCQRVPHRIIPGVF